MCARIKVEREVSWMKYIKVGEAAKQWNLGEQRVSMMCCDGKIAGAKK